ncbi:hypothetical protein LEP1GSC071_2037 [Leptospira santarosai str. JET]|nr:hypothetical protein LEP1GSC071_2037 [Leptospira santarosai str. JET]
MIKRKIEIYNKIKEGMRLYKIQSLWELPQVANFEQRKRLFANLNSRHSPLCYKLVEYRFLLKFWNKS